MAIDPIQEVAEAAAKRKEQIRKWQQEQIDADKAVTFLEDPRPKDPSPEEVQKVNMQGADDTLGGPTNEESTEKGAAPVYENVGEVSKEADANYPADEQDTGPDYIEVEEPRGQGASDEGTEGQPDEKDEPGVASRGDRPDAEVGDSEEAPAHSAKKAEWVAYRVKTHGLTQEEAEAYTKDELVDLK